MSIRKTQRADDLSVRAAREIVRAFIETGEGVTDHELAEVLGCSTKDLANTVIYDVTRFHLYDEIKCSCGAVKSKKLSGHRYTPSIELLREHIKSNNNHHVTKIQSAS